MMHFNTQMAILTFSKMVDTGDSMTEALVLIKRILRFRVQQDIGGLVVTRMKVNHFSPSFHVNIPTQRNSLHLSSHSQIFCICLTFSKYFNFLLRQCIQDYNQQRLHLI